MLVLTLRSLDVDLPCHSWRALGSAAFGHQKACFQQTRPQKWSQDMQERKVKLFAVCFRLEMNGNHLNAKMSYLWEYDRISGNLSKNDLGKGIHRRKVQNLCSHQATAIGRALINIHCLQIPWSDVFSRTRLRPKVGKPTYFHETVRCSKRQTWLKSTT